MSQRYTVRIKEVEEVYYEVVIKGHTGMTATEAEDRAMDALYSSCVDKSVYETHRMDLTEVDWTEVDYES